MESSSTPVRRGNNVLPLPPTLTPAIGTAGGILIATGLIYCLVGIRQRSIHTFLSCAYLTSLGVTVLIIYLIHPNISNALQGALFVAACVAGLIVGGFSLMVKGAAEQFGCFLGGFCFSMWMMTLRPGGLIQSQAGATAFIILVSLASYAVSFIPKARTYTMLACASFAGATAIVLGIDCFTRAGLKEFWIYIWRVDENLFPIDTNSYPITRYIAAEIGCIPVLFLFGLLSQFKLYKVVEQRQNARLAEARLVEDDQEKQENAIARQKQEENARDLELWEATYGEKKTAKVTQTSSPPDSPARTTPKRHSSKLRLSKRSSEPKNATRTTRVAAKGGGKDEITAMNPISQPVPTREESDLNIEVDKSFRDATMHPALRDSVPLAKQYQSLRPRSNPPPPNLSPLSLPSVPFAGEGDRDSLVSSLDLGHNEQSADLSGAPRFKVSSLNLDSEPAPVVQNENSHLPEMPEQWPDTEVGSKSKHDTFDFEVIASGDEADMDSIQNSNLAEDEPTKTPKPDKESSHSEPRRTRSGIMLDDLTDVPRREIKMATMDRTNQWASMLDEAEDPESSIRHGIDDVDSHGTFSTRDGTEPERMEQAENMWSGFEGAYSSTAATTVEAHVEGTSPTEKTSKTAPTAPSIQNVSRPKAANHKKCKSTQSTPSTSKAPILPSPVKSARVHKRNASLPVLMTAPTLVEQREAILADRQLQSYTSQPYLSKTNTSSRASSIKPPTSTDQDDNMTLAERRVSLQQQQQARRMSSGQISLSSSTDPRTCTFSTTTRSPEATTARTSPIPTSPSYPAFAMTAHPLRGSYPQPPYGFTSSSRRSSSNAISPTRTCETPAITGTLLDKLEEQQQRHEKQMQAQRIVRQQAAEMVRKGKREMENRRRQMAVDEMMRRGQLEGAHQEALRKMQRIAARNAE